MEPEVAGDIHIRGLQPGDVERLVEIALAAWEPIYMGFRETVGEAIFSGVYPDWRAEKGGQIRAACDPTGRGRMQVLVACEAETGEIVGFVTYRMDGERQLGELGNNAVWPECRGRGIAPRLYEAAFDAMRAHGMRYVRVRTGLDAAHAPARRAYEKVGFRPGPPSIDYYREL